MIWFWLVFALKKKWPNQKWAPGSLQHQMWLGALNLTFSWTLKGLRFKAHLWWYSFVTKLYVPIRFFLTYSEISHVRGLGPLRCYHFLLTDWCKMPQEKLSRAHSIYSKYEQEIVFPCYKKKNKKIKVSKVFLFQVIRGKSEIFWEQKRIFWGKKIM